MDIYYQRMLTLRLFFVLISFLQFLSPVSNSTPASIEANNLEMPRPNGRMPGELEDLEFRVAIEPNKVECFYQEAKAKHELDISYQVIELKSRLTWLSMPTNVEDMKINFYMKDPRGEVIKEEFNKDEGSHVHQVGENAGVYTFCFDNTVSSISSTKMVNIEIYLSSDEDDDRWGYMEDDFTMPPDIQYADSVESIKASMDKVRDSLITIGHNQDEKRAIEKRDRNIMEQNYTYINRFSMLSIFAFAVIGLFQIFMIRSLFEEKNYLKKMFKIW